MIEWINLNDRQPMKDQVILALSKEREIHVLEFRIGSLSTWFIQRIELKDVEIHVTWRNITHWAELNMPEIDHD